MNLTPVITRELRGEARRTMNYWLRLAGAAAVLAALLLLSLRMQGFAIGQGGRLFNSLNLTLFAAIWLVAPLLTADCISAEKREGTLGLLFLTPLKPRDIVIAKSLVHTLRALSLLLAALPVLAIPLLLGGVTWMDLARAALMDFSAVVLALTTGLLASCWCREWSRTTMLALGLSLGSGFFFVALHGAYWVWQWMGTGRTGFSMGQFARALLNYLESRLANFPLLQLGQDVPFYFIWRGRGGGGTSAQSVWLAGALLGVALVLALLVMWLAARRIRRAWQEEPPTRRQAWWLRVFCTPQFWRGLFGRYMRRSLERNPIGWLQEYSWSARLSKWGWCLGLVLVECVLFAGSAWGLYVELQKPLGLALALGIGLTAAGSFRKERQTGALELILVTPLRVRQIILGRLIGLWSQFLPSVIIVISIWLYLIESRQYMWRGWFGGSPTESLFPLWLASTYLTMPVVGLLFSLSPRHVIVNWLWACVVGLLMPWVVGEVVVALVTPAHPVGPVWGSSARGLLIGELSVAAITWLLLTRNLTQRSFVLRRAAPV
jgi:ABC-type transport system involved in multi-copper enzyme maturation permease subunit